MNSSFKKELMYSNMFKAIIPSYVNYYFILKNLNKKNVFTWLFDSEGADLGHVAPALGVGRRDRDEISGSGP